MMTLTDEPKRKIALFYNTNKHVYIISCFKYTQIMIDILKMTSAQIALLLYQITTSGLEDNLGYRDCFF